MIQSTPSVARTVSAYSIYAAGGLAAVAWKVLRYGSIAESLGIPNTAVGILPNLLPAAVLPALIFMRPQTVRFSEYLKIVLAVFAVLVAYEIAQLWMPSRTFDLFDLAATFLGAGLGCALCWLVFFHLLGSRSDTRYEQTDKVA